MEKKGRRNEWKRILEMISCPEEEIRGRRWRNRSNKESGTVKGLNMWLTGGVYSPKVELFGWRREIYETNEGIRLKSK